MKMSKHSRLNDLGQMELPLTLFAEDSPAKTFPSPEKAQDLVASEAVSGLSFTASSKKSARNTLSLKTSQPFALEDWTKYSGRSLRSGMMRSGIVYPLPPLVLLTKGTASGLWRTPNAGDAKACLTGTQNQVMLAHQVHWPTPDANIGNRGTSAVAPTGKRLSGAKQQITLNDAVKWWPTPTAHNAKEGGYPAEHLRNTPTLSAVVGGKLNPTWVEWLMGFPIGHTVCEHSVTRLSRKSPKLSEEQS
jgi:hypothetical protein